MAQKTPQAHPGQPPARATRVEEMEAEVVVLRATLLRLRTNLSAARRELDQRLSGLRQWISEQISQNQWHWNELHQQLADERSRTYGQLQGQIQRAKSPLQIGLSLLSPQVARENVRAIRASRQALLRPTPQEHWLQGQIAQAERTIDWWRRELVQPRENARMQELRKQIAWLTGEIQRQELRADALDARIAAARQQPLPVPAQPPVQAGTTGTVPAIPGQPSPAVAPVAPGPAVPSPAVPRQPALAAPGPGPAQQRPVQQVNCWYCGYTQPMSQDGTCARCRKDFQRSRH